MSDYPTVKHLHEIIERIGATHALIDAEHQLVSERAHAEHQARRQATERENES